MGITRLVLLLMPVVGFCAAFGQLSPSGPNTPQIKADYLYNFGKFIRWSGPHRDAIETFQICVLGKGPVGQVIDSVVANGSIDNKKVTVEKLSSIQKSDHCHVLFVSASERSNLKTIFALAKTGRFLTVSDVPHFARRGGMIEFMRHGDKIGFEVNLSATEEAGITLNSELMRVATKVIGGSVN